MRVTTDARSHDKGVSARKFVVNLTVLDGNDPEVRSCEIIGHNYRNRTSFGERTRLDDVFVAAIADGLSRCLDKMSNDTEVLALPDFVVETPGLTLAGAHMMVSKGDDGTLHIIFRFRFFLGGINRAFHRNIGFDGEISDENSRLSALVLADLALPILNFCEAAKAGMMTQEAPISGFVDKLVERSHEISFQIELVKRFIEHPATASLEIVDYPNAYESARRLGLLRAGQDNY